MNDKVKILGEVQKTLLIPLYGRAMDYGKKNSLLNDKYAHDIVEQIDFDFETEFKKMPVQSSIMSCRSCISFGFGSFEIYRQISGCHYCEYRSRP